MNKRCDKCNIDLKDRERYELSYSKRKYWVCGDCMQEIIKKEILTSNCEIQGEND